MASPLHPQPPWMSTLKTSKPFKSSKNLLTSPPLKFVTRLSSSSNSDDSSSPDSEQNEVESKNDRVNLAFSKALEYKKSLRLSAIEKTGDTEAKIPPINESVGSVEEKATEFDEDKGIRVEKARESPGDEDGKDELPDAVRIAMEKAREYKKNKGTVISTKGATTTMDGKSPGDENGNDDVSEAATIYVEKAKELKKNKGTVSSGESSEQNEKAPGSSNGSKNERTNGTPKLNVSKIDFIGLDFSDKKERRGLPPGLVPTPDPYMGKDMPDVEMIVGDASKFGNTLSDVETTQEDALDLYKPKVSTWGVFPRPNNISKTFGGGRNIRPGETLETEEVKAAKEARTKQLIAEYRAQMGLDVNPKLKAECAQALKDGDELMDSGRLKDALPYYEQVMEKMTFQTELHGLAALQWAICQDSLTRSDEAQGMYKKLKSHSNALVNKKANQLAFSFEAMDMLKVRRSPPRNPGYDAYFDAFVPDKPKVTSQEPELEEGVLVDTLPYIVFLALPVLVVLLIASKHGI